VCGTTVLSSTFCSVLTVHHYSRTLTERDRRTDIHPIRYIPRNRGFRRRPCMGISCSRYRTLPVTTMPMKPMPRSTVHNAVPLGARTRLVARHGADAHRQNIYNYSELNFAGRCSTAEVRK